MSNRSRRNGFAVPNVRTGLSHDRMSIWLSKDISETQHHIDVELLNSAGRTWNSTRDSLRSEMRTFSAESDHRDVNSFKNSAEFQCTRQPISGQRNLTFAGVVKTLSTISPSDDHFRMGVQATIHVPEIRTSPSKIETGS
jgi:hypothetical protein